MLLLVVAVAAIIPSTIAVSLHVCLQLKTKVLKQCLNFTVQGNKQSHYQAISWYSNTPNSVPFLHLYERTDYERMCIKVILQAQTIKNWLSSQ